MALYAIGDLHLSFGTDKPMDVFGGGWVNYIDKIKKNFDNLENDDVCVLCGDISWGMSLEESLKDFKFINDLPGKKIIIKGNHDYWWTTATKMKAFFEDNGITSIEILHNNCYFYEDVAICGTRGWMTDDELTVQQNEKVLAREFLRLQASLATADGASTKICFFHYPPRTITNTDNEFITLMKEHGVTRCVFGHLHGHGHKLATTGDFDGIQYKLVSADFIDFIPQVILR